MNPYEIIALVIIVVVLAGALRGRHSRRRGSYDGDYAAEENGETHRLREEVRNLKERVQVLERIATDRETSLAQEIERLRDQ